MDGAVTDADTTAAIEGDMAGTGAGLVVSEVESAVSEVESAVSEGELAVSEVESVVSEVESAGVMAAASAGVMAAASAGGMAAASAGVMAAADTDNGLFQVPEAGDHFCHRCAPRHCCGLA